jgi:2-dehydro-3-deoxyphosphogluconate aldolase/(4S)-4-hydroxy-2-oxoglutarate aldolase
VDFLPLLRSRRLLAIVRGHNPEATLQTVITLAQEGFNLIEVSLTSAQALQVMSQAHAALGPQTNLGAGTVLTARDAQAAQQAGASFIVTPGLSESVHEAHRLGLPTVAGSLTPTDVIAAVQTGASVVKLFPASALGGPDYLQALRSPFPEVPFVPVGGVDIETGRRYLELGATAIGVGNPLIGDAADGGDLQALRERARQYLRIAQEVA